MSTCEHHLFSWIKVSLAALKRKYLYHVQNLAAVYQKCNPNCSVIMYITPLNTTQHQLQQLYWPKRIKNMHPPTIFHSLVSEFCMYQHMSVIFIGVSRLPTGGSLTGCRLLDRRVYMDLHGSPIILESGWERDVSNLEMNKLVIQTFTTTIFERFTLLC